MDMEFDDLFDDLPADLQDGNGDWKNIGPPNPYEYGLPVTDESGFTGRRTELRTILSKIRSKDGGVIFLRGDYRIGKSSIIRYAQDSIMAVDELKRTDVAGQLLVPFSFTAEELVGGGGRSVLEHLCSLLGLAVPPNTECSETVVILQKGLADAAADGRHVVFFIDEVSLLPHCPDAEEFIQLMPGLVRRFPVHIILSGPRDFTKLNWRNNYGTQGGRKSSVNRNDVLDQSLTKLEMMVTKVQVGALSIGEAVELIRLSERAEHGKEDLTYSLRGCEEIVLEMAGTIPYLIQIVCHSLFKVLFEYEETRLDKVTLENRLKAVDSEGGSGYFSVNPRKVLRGDRADAEIEDEPWFVTEQQMSRLESEAYEQAKGYFDNVWDDLLTRGEKEILENLQGGMEKRDWNVTDPIRSLLDRGYLRQRGDRIWSFSSLFTKHLRSRKSLSRWATIREITLEHDEDSVSETSNTASIIPDCYQLDAKEMCDLYGIQSDIESSEIAFCDQRFRTYLESILTFFSQMAVSLYSVQPDLHTAELNTALKQWRYRSLTNGSRFKVMRDILHLDGLNNKGVLYLLKSAMLRERSHGNLLVAIANAIQLVKEQDVSPKTVNIIEFLESCISWRNQLSHGAQPPDNVRIQFHQYVWSAFGEMLQVLSEETKDLAMINLVNSCTLDSSVTEIEYRSGWDLVSPVSKARQSGGKAKRKPGTGYYPIRAAEDSKSAITKLLPLPLYPLIVSGELLSRYAPEDLAIVKAETYMVTGASKTSLKYAALNMTSKEIIIKDGNDEDGASPVQLYNNKFSEM